MGICPLVCAPSNRAYAGIWMPNSGNVQWLVHLDANGTDYQVWFDGATQIPMRPALVIPTEDHAYLSVFRDDSVGAWDARHGLSSAAYQKAFDDFVAHGKLPLDVHGGGSGSNARYAAVFAGQVDPEPRDGLTIATDQPDRPAEIMTGKQRREG